MNEAGIFFLITCVIVVASIIVRIFNKLSGLEKLKSEREILTREKRDFEIAKASTESRQSLKEQELHDKEEHLKILSDDIAARSLDLRNQEYYIKNLVREKTVELAKNIASRDYLSETPVFSAITAGAISYDRLLSSLTSNMKVSLPFDISASIKSGGKMYTTTLYHCNCPDYRFRNQPCKHMVRLGLEVGVLLGVDTRQLRDEVSFFVENRQAYMREKADIIKKRKMLHHLEHTQDQTYSWLAKLRADVYEAVDEQYVTYLLSKNRPAIQTAAEVKRVIYGELRESRERAKQLEYQLHFYESIFPWLEDYKDISPLDAFTYEQSAADVPQDEDHQYQYKDYISQKEWFDLSEQERYQLILERYIAKKKTNWEIGIEYERYVGYLCEKHGYSVTYNGARTKLEDMGRDLILRRDDEVILIQCKRWALKKTVHENHVFQLAGSVFEYQCQHPQLSVSGVLVTSTTLSDIATHCADALGIKVCSGVQFQEYPRIKCNIGRDGSRIYHLPVDQQYDNVVIDADGEFYAATVAEAESAGFRRAYRWRGSSQSEQPKS